MGKKLLILLFFSIIFPVFALDALPMYLDAGCEHGGIPKSYASGLSDLLTASIGGAEVIPINCTEVKSGTDAAELKLVRKLKEGDHY